MHLSRLELALHDRQVLRDLADVHQLHRTVMSGFPDFGEEVQAARAKLSVLHRLEWSPKSPTATLLVQSEALPDWGALSGSYLAAPPEVGTLGQLEQSFVVGARFRFRLRANPTKKQGTTTKSERLAGQKKCNGRRVPVAAAELTKWLEAQGQQHGFRVMAALEHPDLGPRGGDATGRKGPRGESMAINFRAVRFDGLLEVVDVALFQEAWRQGIGPGKAYGFGLLSLAPYGG